MVVYSNFLSFSGNNRNRSRSPVRSDNSSRRRDNKMDGNKQPNSGVGGNNTGQDISMMMMNQISQYGQFYQKQICFILLGTI